jgi:hypothetical protein
MALATSSEGEKRDSNREEGDGGCKQERRPESGSRPRFLGHFGASLAVMLSAHLEQ